ncbi:MAG: hypothetical protein ABFS56_08130 [Pseudomonadota bacterium]
MKKEEIIRYAPQAWKSHIEYYNEQMFIHGYPYYQITEVDDIYYLLELDLNDPDSYNYHIMEQSDNFSYLYEKGMALEDALGQKYRSMNLYRLVGKELIEKLNSASEVKDANKD